MYPRPKIDTSHKSPNHGGFRRKPQKAVLHATVGGYLSSIHYLCHPKSKASTNYIISKKGEIAELVDPIFASWGNGISIKGWGNYDTITFELENKNDGRDPYPDEQLKALATLLLWLDIPKEGVRDHKAICFPKGRKTDLRENFPWARLWQITYGAALPSVAGYTLIGGVYYKNVNGKPDMKQGFRADGLLAKARKLGWKIWPRKV